MLLVLAMLLSLVPMSALAANETTIKVTANPDRATNPTIISVYSRAVKYFKAHTSYPVTYEKTEGGYDFYTAEGAGIVEAFIPGKTDKVVATVSAGATVTLNLPNLSAWTSNRYAADMYTNLGDDGTLNLSVDETFALDTFRVWQALGGSVTENNFVEPGFCFEVFGDSIRIERIGGPGREQLEITALQPGVSVIKITYGAVTYNDYSYSAIDPINTYAVVVNVDGGSDFITGINTPGGVVVRNDFDTFYFDNKVGGRDFVFTPASDSVVRVHAPLNRADWGEGWTDGTEDGGMWTVPLKAGRNIIEIKNGDSTRYHLVKARGVAVTVANLSTPDSDIAVGETARITIRGIESPIEKMTGVYNPGFVTAPYLQYKSGVAVVKSDRSGQYEPLNKTFTIDYTLNDAAENVLTGGQIQGAGGFFGNGMYLGYHREIPIDGIIGSFSGGAPDMYEIFFGALPEITIDVDPERSAVSPFTDDGWLVVDCGEGGTNSDNLTTKLRDLVGTNNLGDITKLRIIGTMNNYDFYPNANMSATASNALHGGNSTSTTPALLTSLVELDLSGLTDTSDTTVTPVLPNQALRCLMALERLRLPAGLNTTNHSLYNLLSLTTVVFGDAPYTDGVIDLTGFTGSALSNNMFGRYFSENVNNMTAKVITRGDLGVPLNGFNGLKNLKEIIFTGDTLGEINTGDRGAFNAGIKSTAIAYVPAGTIEDGGENYTNLARYFDNIKELSDYTPAAGLEAERDELKSAVAAAQAEYSGVNPGYTAESWAALQKAIADADTISAYVDYMVTTGSFNGAAASIVTAIGYLKVDKTRLEDAIHIANALNESDWSEDTWLSLVAAHDAAKDVYYDKNAMLPATLNAINNLTAAIGALAERLGDKSWLNDRITQYSGTRKIDFTSASDWDKFNSVMDEAKELVLGTPTVKEVNAVEEALVIALGNVVFIGDLRHEINNAKSLNKASYTADSWAVLERALDDAETVFEKADATNAEVDTVTNALRQSAMGLQTAGNTGDGTGGTTPTKSVTATFRLIGNTKHEEFDAHGKYITWVATKTYTFNNVDRITVYDLFTRALNEAGIKYEGADNNYVSKIQAPSVLGGFWLGEFDNGPNSGWMYTIDGEHSGRGLKDYYVYDGNAVIWHYVDDYTRETSFEGNTPDYLNRWLEAEDVAPTAGMSGNTSGQTVESVEINITATTKNGGAEAAADTDKVNAALAKAVENTNDGGLPEVRIIVDVDDKATSLSLTINTDALKSIAGAEGAQLTIQSGIGAVTIDNATLKGIVEGASGSANAVLSIAPADMDALTDSARKAVGDAAAFTLTITVAGKAVTGFKGTVTVFLPYILPSGVKSGDLTVFHVADDGAVEQMRNVEYTTIGGVTGYQFQTSHFSVFMVAAPLAKMAFTDVNSGNWFYDAVKYVFENGLMEGVSATAFQPDATMTRAMAVTVLYRLEGKPETTAENPFTDVTDGAWYSDAIIWASENKIVNGVGGGVFDINGSVTRQQLAAILYRYAEFKGYDVSKTTDMAAYTDADGVADWASAAMNWAVAEGIITGTTAATLSPTGTATRAQVATMLMRFAENIV